MEQESASFGEILKTPLMRARLYLGVAAGSAAGGGGLVMTARNKIELLAGCAMITGIPALLGDRALNCITQADITTQQQVEIPSDS